jgi:glycosyltransferase involved in cell wall biosynthesis
MTEDAGSSPERRLLVVAYHAPPGRAVGGLRWWGLSRHLALRGWRVHLITSQEGAALEEVPSGMTVEEVPPLVTPDQAYRSFKRRLRTRRRKGAGSSDPAPGNRSGTSDHEARRRGPDVGGKGERGSLDRLRRDLGGVLAFPDEGQGWILPASRAVRRAHDEWAPSVMVSTGPPHSVHLAAAWGRRVGRSVPWVVDFRDAWSDVARAHLDVSWAPMMFSRLEASVIGAADHTLTTTPELAEIFRRRFPGTPTAFLPNGVDVAALPAAGDPRPRDSSDLREFHIMHLGTLYLNRDPVPTVRGFGAFLRTLPESERSRARLSFIGTVRKSFRARIEAVAREEGVLAHVEMPGPVPRDEALRILSRASVSLVLAQDQETAVPAKIYEAAGQEIPALVITEAGSASAGAGRRLGARVHDPADIEGIAGALRAAWSGEWTGALPPGVSVDYRELSWDAENLLTRIARGP